MYLGKKVMPGWCLEHVDSCMCAGWLCLLPHYEQVHTSCGMIANTQWISVIQCGQMSAFCAPHPCTCRLCVYCVYGVLCLRLHLTTWYFTCTSHCCTASSCTGNWCHFLSWRVHWSSSLSKWKYISLQAQEFIIIIVIFSRHLRSL